MTPDQWQEIRAQHEQQGISKSTLAKIHGVTRQAIQILMDALSQVHKINLTSASDKPTESGIAAELLSYFDTEQLHEWSELEAQQDAILEAVQAYKLEQEQGIKSIRKKG